MIDHLTGARSAALAGAAALLLALGGLAPATAADLGGLDNQPDYEPPVLASTIRNHWYAGLRGGAAFTNDTGFNLATTSVSTDYSQPGFYGSGAVGYDFSGIGKGWRVEAELAYLRSSVDTHTIGGLGTIDGTGTRSALVGFANAYYDLPMTESTRVFLGGGIGVANLGLNNQGTAPTGTVMDSSDTAFAWNLTSGVNVALSKSVDFELGYRYLRIENADLTALDGTSSSVDSADHIVFAGVKYKF